MSNAIVIYTKDNCPYCDQAKTLFRMRDQRFQEMKIGVDVTREEFIDTFPEVRTVPFIIIDGEQVGGYDRLIEYYNRPERNFLAE
jgi:glutaredoxin 3